MVETTGKLLLQASIASVRQYMPENTIHVLYNGQRDAAFLAWLRAYGVVIHRHEPVWRDDIEEMRKNGDPGTSHLFLHAGNYFGTWQRIDIPLFVESEYCLLLDSDTLVTRPFTLEDFGMNLTRGIAMSAEMSVNDKIPTNAGVTLMNVPLLRQTHEHFIKYILSHVDSAKFEHPSPSDQGAYLSFYRSKTSFLSNKFNFKPYWKSTKKVFDSTYIVHFHGPKPHNYMEFILGKGCDEAVKGLCHQGTDVCLFVCLFVAVACHPEPSGTTRGAS